MSGANQNVMRAAMLQENDDTTSPFHFHGVLDTMYGQAMQVCPVSRPRVVRSDTHSHPPRIFTCNIVCNNSRSDPEVQISAPTLSPLGCVGQDPLLRLGFLGATAITTQNGARAARLHDLELMRDWDRPGATDAWWATAPRR